MQNMGYHVCLTDKIFLLEIKQYCRFLKIPLFFFNLLVFYIRRLKQFRKFNTEQVKLYTYIVVEKSSIFSKKNKFKFQEPVNL